MLDGWWMVTVGKISAVTLLQVARKSRCDTGDFPLTTTLRVADPLAQVVTTHLFACKCLALTHVKF